VRLEGQEVLGELIDYVPLTRHGPPRDVFTEPLPSNGTGIHIQQGDLIKLLL
jgi:hypothetical protein